MPKLEEDPDFYTTLLDASQKAIATSHFEAAYHTLTAALHVAQDTERADYLDNIASVALAQLAHIDRYAPQNTMSTAASVARGRRNMYAMLAKQAKARAQMVRNNSSTFRRRNGE